VPKLWTKVDRYFCDRLAPIEAEDVFEAARAVNKKAGLPGIDVSRLQGKFLELLVRISGARHILEIGTLGGYSTLWLADALPENGRIVTLEFDARHAETARKNLRNAGVLDRVEIIVGRAIDTLPTLETTAGPFDLIFIDADKQSYPEYLQWSMRLSRSGTVIVADNVVRDGKVIDANSRDRDVQGVRRFTELLAAEPRLSATVLQTVGVKGYDGLTLAVVLR
jgi:predicted O-methyltransferase YrrM